MSGSYDGPERRTGEERRSDVGPTPGAKKILDEHGEQIAHATGQLRFGLFVCGALFFLLLAAGTVAGILIDNAFDTIRSERQARTDAAASILDFGCQTDNAQDTLLADLVEISLTGGTFGAGIDPDDLTPDELAIVTAIAHVQQLAQAAPPTPQQRVFERKLKELRDLTPCTELVNSFIDGETVPPPLPDKPKPAPPPTTPDRVLGQ